MTGRVIDWSDDSGQVAGIEVLPFSILIFVVGTLIVANAWAVIDVKLAVDAASREAVRAFVEAPDAATGCAAAERVATEAVDGHGRHGDRLTLEPHDCRELPFRRCAAVTMRASYPAPLLTVPLIGGFGDGLRVTSSHTELIDPYRSGPTASGTC